MRNKFKLLCRNITHFLLVMMVVTILVIVVVINIDYISKKLPLLLPVHEDNSVDLSVDTREDKKSIYYKIVRID